MIVIKASNGDGVVTIGGTILLLNAVYEDSGATEAQIAFSLHGTVAGTPVTISGPSGWTWLNSGAAGDYEIYCQPTSGSFGGGDVNKWKAMDRNLTWIRQNSAGQNVTATFTVRDRATQTTQATCTITLQDD